MTSGISRWRTVLSYLWFILAPLCLLVIYLGRSGRLNMDRPSVVVFSCVPFVLFGVAHLFLLHDRWFRAKRRRGAIGVAQRTFFWTLVAAFAGLSLGVTRLLLG
jgi:hypothetical protein